MTPEQEARLPKFARDEINNLRRKLAEADAAARRLSDSRLGADGFVDYYASYPLGVVAKGQHVRFPFDGLDGRHWLDVTRDGQSLEIMGSGSLYVRPDVTNRIHVGLTEA